MVDLLTPILSAMINMVSLLLGKMLVLVHLRCVNALDYSGYPDCRKEYIKSFEVMANLATKQGVEGKKLTILLVLVHLRSFLLDLKKSK
jgi:7-cyano-7-deazaguanine synthase in queuosine biosynthesis